MKWTINLIEICVPIIKIENQLILYLWQKHWTIWIFDAFFPARTWRPSSIRIGCWRTEMPPSLSIKWVHGKYCKYCKNCKSCKYNSKCTNTANTTKTSCCSILSHTAKLTIGPVDFSCEQQPFSVTCFNAVHCSFRAGNFYDTEFYWAFFLWTPILLWSMLCCECDATAHFWANEYEGEKMSMRERTAFFLDREISQESPSASALASQTYAFYMAVSWLRNLEREVGITLSSWCTYLCYDQIFQKRP